MKSKLLFVVLLLGFGLSSCLFDDDIGFEEPDVYGSAKIKFNTTVQGNTHNFDDYFTTKSGNVVRFTKLKFFLGNTRFIDIDGDEEGGEHFGLLEPTAGITEWEIDRLLFGKYAGLRFNIGVDSVTNHSDPATFPSDNVLNPLVHKGMFWDWRSGYIFIKLEGKYITTAGDTSNFLYHVGTDQYLLPYQFDQVKTLDAGGTMEYEIELDLYKVMSEPNEFDINVAGNTSHTSPGDTNKVPVLAENLKKALSIK